MHDVMKFELFPNEILIQCFEFLNGFEIFDSFDQLNYRFYKLIRNIPLCLNFEYMDKSTFDQFCMKTLLNPEVKSQIYSLHLSDKETNFQLEAFLSLFSLDEFPHLRSLTVTEVHQDSVTKLGSMLSSIPELRYLHLPDGCLTSKTSPDVLPISKLRTLSVTTDSPLRFIHETSSIRNLTISHCSLGDLYQLLKYTPLLKYLNIQYLNYLCSIDTNAYSANQCAVHLEQILIGRFGLTFKNFEMLLQQAPNVKSLTISASDNTAIIDGYQWQQLIRSSLPHLETFKFKFSYSCHNAVYKVIDEKFQHFQTDFWHKQHHWFTEYSSDEDSAVIYTIPYHFSMYQLLATTKKHSNKLLNSSNKFENVIDLKLDLGVLTEKCQYYFPNVRSLTFAAPPQIDVDRLSTTRHVESLKTIVNLLNIKHLNVWRFCEMENSLILLEILKEAPQLSSLAIHGKTLESIFKDRELCTYLNKRIKKLYLYVNDGCLFDDADQRKEFCEIFSNIEHLECFRCSPDDLVFMLSYLSKLSSAKVISAAFFGSENTLSRLQNETGRENIMVRMTTAYVSFFISGSDAGCYKTTVLIWTGKNMT